jgi:stress-induced morphogen
MAQVVNTPKYLATLVKALEGAFSDASIDAERIRGADGYHYRIAVVSESFQGMNWRERHDAVWKVARELLSEEQMLRVAGIVAVAPQELNGA